MAKGEEFNVAEVSLGEFKHKRRFYKYNGGKVRYFKSNNLCSVK